MECEESDHEIANYSPDMISIDRTGAPVKDRKSPDIPGGCFRPDLIAFEQSAGRAPRPHIGDQRVEIPLIDPSPLEHLADRGAPAPQASPRPKKLPGV